MVVTMLVGAAAVVLWLLTRPASMPREGLPVLPQSGKCFREVVGESKRQDALRELASAQKMPIFVTAAVVPEPSNPVDPDAVRVEIHGRHVGYLNAKDAYEFQRRLRAAGMQVCAYAVPAMITGQKGRYGVWLDLPDAVAPRR